jgi:hypothetical protein
VLWDIADICSRNAPTGRDGRRGAEMPSSARHASSPSRRERRAPAGTRGPILEFRQRFDGWRGAGILLRLFARALAGDHFGAAASFAALLLWLYYTAQIFLFGVEFTAVLGGLRAGERPLSARSPIPLNALQNS